VGTFVVLRQMHYFRTKPLGFSDKAIALVDIPGGSAKNPFFKNSVLQIPGVRAASFSNGAAATDGVWTSGFTFDHHAHQEGFEVIYKMADADFLSTFHIALAAGRPPYPSDTIREAMINETTARNLGYARPADILGKTVSLTYHDKTNIPIVGVVKDFVSTNLKEKIKPLLLLTDTGQYYILAVSLDPEKIGEVMPRIQKLFAGLYPERIYNAPFFDEKIVSFYQTEVTAVTLFKVFAGLAIFISCLGLYGLVSFMAAQRTKEVGIRKTLGASVQSIVLLFSKEFTLLTIGAFVIAAPLGYYLMSKWLEQYYNRTPIGWDIFAAAIGLSIIIAWVTVGYRAVRAALADPVKALKHE
jgi:putative ABC transport system permease protein